MFEKPQRQNIGPKLMRETSVGPVDKFLRERAEWMVKESKIKEYLAPQIKFKDKLAGEVEKGVVVACIGAGKGHELDEIDSVLPGTNIIAVDPHDYWTKPVKKRAKQLANNIKYLPEKVSAENLDGVSDDSVNALTYYFVLHHIPSEAHKKVLQEAKRVLKKKKKQDDPGSYLFIAEDLVKDEEERKKVEIADRMINLEVTKDSTHNYRNIDEWKGFFEENGFEVVESHEVKPDKVRHGFFVLRLKQ